MKMSKLILSLVFVLAAFCSVNAQTFLDKNAAMQNIVAELAVVEQDLQGLTKDDFPEFHIGTSKKTTLNRMGELIKEGSSVEDAFNQCVPNGNPKQVQPMAAVVPDPISGKMSYTWLRDEMLEVVTQ